MKPARYYRGMMPSPRGWPISYNAYSRRRRSYLRWLPVRGFDHRFGVTNGPRMKRLRPAPAWKPWRWQRGE